MFMFFYLLDFLLKRDEIERKESIVERKEMGKVQSFFSSRFVAFLLHWQVIWSGYYIGLGVMSYAATIQLVVKDLSLWVLSETR